MKTNSCIVVTFLSAILTVIIAGCAASAAKMRMEDIRDTITQFNQHIRWKRCHMAAPMVVPLEQGAFMEKCDDLVEDLGIRELNIYSVILSEENTKATARMRFIYYQLPRNNLIKKSATTVWVKNGTTWQLQGGTGAFYDELFTDFKLEEETSTQPDSSEQLNQEDNI
jgi:hypothetical protein